jgi:Gpi18-like mannosyltransferase
MLLSFSNIPTTQSPARHSVLFIILFLLGLALAMLLRAALFGFKSDDYTFFTQLWYEFIQTRGGFPALKFPFANYAPPYLYLLAFASYFPIRSLYAIKLISVVFDFLLAVFAMLIVKLKDERRAIRASAFFAVLFVPTVVINSSLWGQCDAIYTTFLLGSIYFVIKRNPLLALTFFSIAFSFKAQAVLLFPLFFILFLKKQISYKYFLIVPVIYFLLILPAHCLRESG